MSFVCLSSLDTNADVAIPPGAKFTLQLHLVVNSALLPTFLWCIVASTFVANILPYHLVNMMVSLVFVRQIYVGGDRCVAVMSLVVTAGSASPAGTTSMRPVRAVCDRMFYRPSSGASSRAASDSAGHVSHKKFACSSTDAIFVKSGSTSAMLEVLGVDTLLGVVVDSVNVLGVGLVGTLLAVVVDFVVVLPVGTLLAVVRMFSVPQWILSMISPGM